MQMFFDFLPIVLFLATFFLFGKFIATGVAIVASILQVGFFYFKFRRFETMHLITLVIVTVLGGMTLWTHNLIFFMWKPTIAYWAFAILFLLSQFFGEKPMLQRMMDGKMDAPDIIWRRLNISWAAFFTLQGIINLFVAYHFSEAFWVVFKFVGALGMFLLFAILQSLFLAKYVREDEAPDASTP